MKFRNGTFVAMRSKVVSLDNMIEETKTRIAKHKEDLNEIKPRLDELNATLRAATDAYYKHLQTCRELEYLIERDIQTVRDLKAKRHKEDAGRVEWMTETFEVLHRENKFMTIAELWQKIIQNPDVKRSMNFMKSPVTMEHLRKKLIAAATAPMNSRSIIIYEDGFGLPSWIDSSGKPVDEYGDRFKFSTILKQQRIFK